MAAAAPANVAELRIRHVAETVQRSRINISARSDCHSEYVTGEEGEGKGGGGREEKGGEERESGVATGVRMGGEVERPSSEGCGAFMLENW